MKSLSIATFLLLSFIALVNVARSQNPKMFDESPKASTSLDESSSNQNG